MNAILSMPWLEIAIVLPLVGSLGLSRQGDRRRSWASGVVIVVVTLFVVLLETAAHFDGQSRIAPAWDMQHGLFGRAVFRHDPLSLPLLPVVTLLFLLTIFSTSGTKLQRFSVSWALFSLAVQLATLTCDDAWTLIFLMIAGTLPPLGVLHGRGKPKRVYLLHMGLFAGMLAVGWFAIDSAPADERPVWAVVVLMLAILVRCGLIPVHCWLTDLFDRSSFGNTLLSIAPLTSVYAFIRLAMPIAPEWALDSIGVLSLATAIYAAGMATIQKEARRFFAFVFLSHASLVLVGVQLATPISMTGSLHLWLSFILSLGGFGLVLRALEARVGRLSLTRFHGLYDHSPALGVCFLLTGLASVGFPGTAGFVASELLIDGALEANPWIGVGVIAAAALNGIAVLRVYFLLFTGTRHPATIPLGITVRERISFLTIVAILLIAGLIPDPFVVSRHRAAVAIIAERESGHREPDGKHGSPSP